MLWPKKNSYEEFDTKKKFLRLEHSPSPYNFSNGPSLILVCYTAVFSVVTQRSFFVGRSVA